MVDESLGGDVTKEQQADAVLWKNKGDELFKQGNYEAALYCYNKGLEIDPNNCNLWNNKGFSLFKLGRREEAQTCKEKIQRLKESSSVEMKLPINEEKQPIIEENSISITPAPTPSKSYNTEETQAPTQKASIKNSSTTASLKCPRCGKATPNDVNFCMWCKTPFQDRESIKKSIPGNFQRKITWKK